jgi:phage-related protein
MDERIGITVGETAHFIKVASALWSSSAELEAFKDFIAIHPLAGDPIPGTGGLRKVRWTRAGLGKRGGVRVIYYFYDVSAPLYLLHAYAKAKQEDLTPDEKKSLARLVKALKARLRARQYGSDQHGKENE